MPRKTLAMVLTGPRRLEPRELPIPELDDDSALLRVEACGICGSDYEQFEGVLRTPVPVIPGHEPVGRIEAIGDRAARRLGVDVGDRVAVENVISCRLCPACLAGQYTLCRARRIYSFVPLEVGHGLWGAYADYMVLDGNSVLHKIDPRVPPELATLFNPLGAGFRWAVELPNTRPGETVLILGPGQRGLASVVACRQVGAGTILVSGLSADRRKLSLAREFGADHTIDVEQEDLRQRVRELTNGRGADVVVDVTPYATAPVAQALDLAAPGGRVILAGTKGFKPIPGFVSDKLVLKEITLRGAIGVTSTGYAAAIRLLESSVGALPIPAKGRAEPGAVPPSRLTSSAPTVGGTGGSSGTRVPLERMHTHEFGLRDAELAIRTLAREIEGQESIHSCLLPGRD